MTQDVTEDKPLHVRVAEALGWTNVAWAGMEEDHWVGSVPPGSPPGLYIAEIDKVTRSIRVAAGSIPRYDTDWAVTGPLIEKCGIGVDLRDAGWAASKFPGDFSWEGCIEFGPTPLIAVCNLVLALKEAGKL